MQMIMLCFRIRAISQASKENARPLSEAMPQSNVVNFYVIKRLLELIFYIL